MGRKPQVQTRLPEETYEDFEKYRDNRDMTDAEATRTLMNVGLDAEPIDPDKWDSTLNQMSPVIQIAGGGVIVLTAIILLAVQLPAAAAATVAAAIGAAIGGGRR